MAHVLGELTEVLDLHLLTASERPPAAIPGTAEHAFATPWPGHESVWLQRRVPPYLKTFAGVFHCPWYALPFRQPVSMVTTLHDLTFEHFRPWFRRGQGAAYRYQARYAARTAKVIVTPSRFVADDIIATYGVDPKRIVVAPWGIDPVFSVANEDSPNQRPYLVAIGGAARRGADIAIAAWRSVADRMDLVVIGESETDPEPGLSHASPADEEWARILAGAFALIYPTRYEGFGMPAMEAIAAGTPVLCAPVGSLPEVLGHAAEWTQGLTARDFAEALNRLLTNPQRYAELREAGLAHAARQPGWADVAEVYFGAYMRAAEA